MTIPPPGKSPLDATGGVVLSSGEAATTATEAATTGTTLPEPKNVDHPEKKDRVKELKKFLFDNLRGGAEDIRHINSILGLQHEGSGRGEEGRPLRDEEDVFVPDSEETEAPQEGPEGAVEAEEVGEEGEGAEVEPEGEEGEGAEAEGEPGGEGEVGEGEAEGEKTAARKKREAYFHGWVLGTSRNKITFSRKTSTKNILQRFFSIPSRKKVQRREPD